MPELSRENLYEAMRARDPRFDGRFYVGVRTTGIYCRPVCPARPLLKNIDFYRSAAEAESAGLRPCLRCRPDLAPTWPGTGAVVDRALRLINEGQADGASLEAFAGKLGVTGRHLRRLFLEHVGAPPVEVAVSKRLHLARLLLRQTRLPVTEVAFAAGFQSIRRFNHAFLARYGESPRAFRGRHEPAAREEITLELPYLEPYDWDYLYRFLENHRVTGLERFENGRYERLVRGKNPGKLSVERDPARRLLLVKLEDVEVREIRPLLARVRHLFDLDHNPLWARGKSGPRSLEGVRVPGAFSGFETAVAVILGQMVSVEVARAKTEKLVEIFGEKIETPFPGFHTYFPRPETLAAADLSPLGITRVRAEAIRELSRRVAAGEIELHRGAPLAETRAQLAAIKGVGPWTIELIAMRCLADPDAFPAGDLILRRAAESLSLAPEPWRPWRSYLALWIWKNYAHKLTQKKKRSTP